MSKREAGAENPKEILSAHLSEEDAAQLNRIRREIARLDLHIERQEIKAYTPKYEKRREITKGIDNFWPVALMHHDIVLVHAQHSSDQSALSYLQDVWVTRHEEEHRAFTIEFTFKENPFFSDKVLKKEFKHKAPKIDDPAMNTPDENGITDAMLEFDSELHLEPSTIKINWKDDEHNLTKLYPRVSDDGDDDVPAESGSFFNFFEQKSDPFEIGQAIAIEIFPNAIDYFLGDVNGSEVDSDEEDDEEDDEDEEEIDLEKPRPKKRKV